MHVLGLGTERGFQLEYKYKCTTKIIDRSEVFNVR